MPFVFHGIVESEVIDTEPYYTQDVARCKRYQAESGWYGLVSLQEDIITRPSYSDIIAVGEDLYLCRNENGYGILLNGKGEKVNADDDR